MIRSAIDAMMPIVGSVLAQPAFLGVASFTLALGMAAAIAALTLVQSLLFGPPPLPEHARIAVYGLRAHGGVTPAASLAMYEAAGMPAGAVARGIARVPERVNAVFGERARLVMAQQVDEGFLATLGVVPEPDRAAAGVLRGAVVSHAFWQHTMHAGAAGRPLFIDGEAMPVRGILPAGYKVFVDVDVLLPLRPLGPQDRHAANMVALARLAPGVAMERFSRDVAARSPASGRQAPDSYGAVPLDRSLTDAARPTVLMFLGAAAVVLAIAGVCVAQLMLSRWLSRAHDMAIREALGAVGWQGRVTVIADAAAVWILAATLAVPAGHLLVEGLRGYVPPSWRLSATPIAPNGGVQASALLAGAVVTALAAWAGFPRRSLEDLLRERVAIDGPSSDGRTARHARGLMIVLLAALATGLIVPGLSLLSRLRHLERVPLGFDPSGAVALALHADQRQYPTAASVARLFEELRTRAARLPGVEVAGLSNHLPVGDRFVMPFVRPDGTQTMLSYALMTPGAAEAMGLGKRAGRWFARGDDAAAERVAMVNEAYLARIDDTGVGGTVRLAASRPPDIPLRIVGVVADTHHAGAARAPEPTVFVPLAQARDPSFAFIRHLAPMYAILRGPTIDVSAGRAFDGALGRLAPYLAAGEAFSMEAVAQRATEGERRDALLFCALAAFATLLAAMGIYSVQSVEVVARRRDLGLCEALGARPVDLFGRLFSLGTRSAAAGTAMGVAGAMLSRAWWSAVPIQGAALAAAVAVMALTTIAAMAPSAARVLRIDPVRVLRGD